MQDLKFPRQRNTQRGTQISRGISYAVFGAKRKFQRHVLAPKIGFVFVIPRISAACRIRPGDGWRTVLRNAGFYPIII
jgi:hypothetical protein